MLLLWTNLHELPNLKYVQVLLPCMCEVAYFALVQCIKYERKKMKALPSNLKPRTPAKCNENMVGLHQGNQRFSWPRLKSESLTKLEDCSHVRSRLPLTGFARPPERLCPPRSLQAGGFPWKVSSEGEARRFGPNSGYMISPCKNIDGCLFEGTRSGGFPGYPQKDQTQLELEERSHCVRQISSCGHTNRGLRSVNKPSTMGGSSFSEIPQKGVGLKGNQSPFWGLL